MGEMTPGAACQDCGNPIHPYARMRVNDDGSMTCGACINREDKRKGKDTRSIQRQHHWEHGHDPNDDDAVKDSPWTYINVEQETKKDGPDQRHLLKGGPETPFPCTKCGSKLRAAAEMSPLDILQPLGYTPPPGTVAPAEKVVVLACPNERDGDRHPVLQIRESMLKAAMKRRQDAEA